LVLKKGASIEPTKFVTLNFKLEEILDQNNIFNQLKQIENIYTEIDNCDSVRNSGWRRDATFKDLFHKTDRSITVCNIPQNKLLESLHTQENWSEFFVTANLFEKIAKHINVLYPDIIDSFRGERTGWNGMFVIPEGDVIESGIEAEFLIPYVKRPSELDVLEFEGKYNFRLFTCSLPLNEIKRNYKGAYNWIKRFEKATNRNGSKTIQAACSSHQPFWYSLRPKRANIVTAINPFERFFFSFSETPFAIDQRLVAINVKENFSVELIAALLNSVVTFLLIEMRGTSRNLGALDLNANYFKRLKVLDPNALNTRQIAEILEAFQPLKQRHIGPIREEVDSADRINFDKTILRNFGIDESVLESLYRSLVASVEDRVKIKER
jgi:hypothetical protein